MDPYHTEPRVPLPKGTDVSPEDAGKILAEIYRTVPGAYVNAMLTVFAPGFKATKIKGR